MISRYDTRVKLSKVLTLSTGRNVDFTAYCDADVTAEEQIYNRMDPPSYEITPKGDYDIEVEEITSDSELEEEPDLTDAEYNEIIEYCNENFTDFE